MRRGKDLQKHGTRPDSASRDALRLSAYIIGAYIILRHIIYIAIPATNFESWFDRDIAMSGPRLAGLCFCLEFMRLKGGWGRWGWSEALNRNAGILILLVTGAYLAVAYPSVTLTSFDLGTILLGWLATGPVALFEEALFRSLLFFSLRERFSPRLAAVLSSLAFMAYHIEAQPVRHWPEIFLFGLGMCAAIQCGAGLAWTVAVHWLIDGSFFNLAVGTDVRGAFALSRIIFLLVGGLSLMALPYD